MINDDDATLCPYCSGEGQVELLVDDVSRSGMCFDCDGHGYICCRCRSPESACECPPYHPPRKSKNGDEDAERDD